MKICLLKKFFFFKKKKFLKIKIVAKIDCSDQFIDFGHIKKP